jgi:formylglycine-generating enzyme required for sulfatase activity
MSRLCSSLLLSLLVVSSASAVTMDWTPIANPGNACDSEPQGCFGGVGYAYNIGTYEVTNAQYAEFLNAHAASDPFSLYNSSMAGFNGGITRTGSFGNWSYAAFPGRENRPVNNVSFFDALRFANWMNNGQGNGDTETGAYTLLGPYGVQGVPSNGSTVTRNAGATIVLPSEDEWYKAAYYSPSGSYLDYPAGSDTPTVCSGPTALANRANCFDAVGNVSPVGSYPGSASPYGTFDQGGNVWEWNETVIIDDSRGQRGGVFTGDRMFLSASWQGSSPPDHESATTGFRLAMIPEPGTGLLVIAGLTSLGGWRRARA